MKSTFKILINPDSECLESNISIFELRKLGAIGAFRFLLSTNRYQKIQIVNNDKNGEVFEIMIHAVLLLNLFSLVVDERFNTVSYLSRMRSLGKIIARYAKLKKLPKDIFGSILKYPPYNEKGTINFSNVLYLKTNLSFGIKAGGSIGHISGVVNALSKKFKVRYISAETPIMLDQRVKVIDVPLKKCLFSFPYELNFLSINSQYINVSISEVEKNKPTVIYQRLTLFNYTGAFLSNKFNIPLVVEYNGSETWVQKNWGKGIKYSKIALDLEDYMLKSASKVITVSKVLVEELIERGIEKSKIVYYPNCIDPHVYNSDSFNPADVLKTRVKYDIPGEDFVFTFIGTFGRWHGIEFLAESIRELIDKSEKLVIDNKIRFLLIGGGLLSDSIRNSLSEEKYLKYVTFTGIVPQEEAPFLLNASDAFLSPHIKQKQRFIGSPTKLFEYMSFGKPIIASDLEQIGEVLKSSIKFPASCRDKDAETARAVLFEANSITAFIDAIKFVVENKETCEKIGKNAKIEVLKNYTWDTHVSKLWQ